MADDNSESVNTQEKQIENKSDKPWLWKPGESGNPMGRPHKGHSITETIRRMMDEKPEIKKALASKILQSALDGDITAMKTIWNYIDGMPLQKQEIGGVDGQPIIITAARGFIPPGTPIASTSVGSNAGELPAVQDDSVAQTG
jgi:hypothetical protein